MSMSESGCDCGTKENAVENSESTNAKAEDEESDEEIDTFIRGSVEVADSSVCVAEPASAITKSPNEDIVAETQDNEQENVQESTRSENFSEEQASQTSEIDSCDSCESVKAEYDAKIQDMSNSLVLLNAKIVKKEDELAIWKKKFEDKCVETKASTQKLQSELTARLEKALRMLEAVKNEKEAAVMKYVVVEQEIAAKEKAVDVSERRRLHCEKEAAQANEKAKHMQIERTKFRQLVEDKENELIFARKEHDKLKCDNATLIQKLKVCEQDIVLLVHFFIFLVNLKLSISFLKILWFFILASLHLQNRKCQATFHLNFFIYRVWKEGCRRKQKLTQRRSPK